MTKTNVSPAIYVGTYAKYNSGSLAGAWLNLTDYSDAEEFLNACYELHKDENDPELMFQDFEGFPKCFYSESMSSDDLENIFSWIALDDDDKKLIEMYASATGYNVQDIDLEKVRDVFYGTADSVADFAEKIAEETGAIPKEMPNWIVIDWVATWNCNLRYDYITARDEDGTIWFFLNH